MKRISWVDNSKCIACILVVLGHLLQGLTQAGILDSSLIMYGYFEKTIYYFHVPLFFVCSGYLHQDKIKNNSYNHKEYLLRKIVNLGIPYLLFSCLTWILKRLFENSVNDSIKESLISCLLINPLQHFWFLYCLLIIFILIKQANSKKEMYLYLFIALVLKIVGDCGLMNAQMINKLFANIIWFVLGMFLSFFKPFDYINQKRKIGCTLLLLFVIASICLISVSNLIVNFFMGILGCLSVIMLCYEDKTSFCMSKYVFQIYLLHTIFAAGIRAILIRFTSNFIIHLTMGAFMSFVGPIVTDFCLKKFKIDISNIYKTIFKC